MQATKTFASYSPAEVALRYLADPTPPSEAVREDFDAAIGFIDVSGFTALSEKLAKEAGDAGAELLITYSTRDCGASVTRVRVRDVLRELGLEATSGATGTPPGKGGAAGQRRDRSHHLT